MVNAIVTGAHPLRNHSQDEVSRLAELFHLLLKHHLSHPASQVDFIRSLRLLAGQGFTVCLADHACYSTYQNYLTPFLHYGAGDFRQHPGALSLLATHLANMVWLACESFGRLPHSGYAPLFLQLLKKTLDSVTLSRFGKTQVVKQLFEQLEPALCR